MRKERSKQAPLEDILGPERAPLVGTFYETVVPERYSRAALVFRPPT